MNDEQLESLLRAADASAGSPAAPRPDLPDRVRNAHARRSRQTVRFKFAGALGGCYVAGMITMWMLLRFAAQPEVAQQRWSASRPDATAHVQPLPHREQDAPTQGIEPLAPVEPQFVVPRSRYDLLRQLGDESQRRGDLQTAVSYYGQALDVATDVERSICYEQDNWLLISLKRDRLSSRHAPTQGDPT